MGLRENSYFVSGVGFRDATGVTQVVRNGGVIVRMVYKF